MTPRRKTLPRLLRAQRYYRPQVVRVVSLTAALARSEARVRALEASEAFWRETAVSAGRARDEARGERDFLAARVGEYAGWRR